MFKLINLLQRKRNGNCNEKKLNHSRKHIVKLKVTKNQGR